MSQFTWPTTVDEHHVTQAEYLLIELVKRSIRSDSEWLGRALLKVLRLKWHNRPIQTEHGKKDGKPLPGGPFTVTRKQQLGDLLVWTPRRIDSYLIDDLTGAYGYSHVTIDTGETDMPTGKPVMMETTVGQTVMRKYQDEYGQRPFVRLPMAKIGIDVEQFVTCVKSKMGEHYDNLDAITLGEIKDPAKEVCTDLASDCLPDAELERIARAKRMGVLSRASVSVHSKPGAAKTRAFVSPNGFAEYYGAPKGKTLAGPDIFVQPQPIDLSLMSMAAAAARHHGSKLAAGVFAVVLLLALVRYWKGQAARAGWPLRAGTGFRGYRSGGLASEWPSREPGFLATAANQTHL